MLPVGFEPKISAGEQQQSHDFDLAVTGTDGMLPNEFSHMQQEGD